MNCGFHLHPLPLPMVPKLAWVKVPPTRGRGANFSLPPSSPEHRVCAQGVRHIYLWTLIYLGLEVLAIALILESEDSRIIWGNPSQTGSDMNKQRPPEGKKELEN